MRTVFGGSAAGARKTGGDFSHQESAVEKPQENQRKVRTENVRAIGNRITFGELARMAWPDKTDINLSFMLQVSTRTARHWLAGDNEPPAEALGIILAEIMRRFNQRE